MRSSEDIGPTQRALAEHLERASGGGVTVRAIEPLGGGACQDNYRVEVTFQAGERAGDHVMALRSDAVKSLPGSLHRGQEHDVINAAARAGVRTPRAWFLGEGVVRPGARAYLLDWVEGTAIGRRVLRDADLAEARKGLTRVVATELAKIHAVTPATPGAPSLPEPPDMLAFTRAMIEAMKVARPALYLALSWLVDHTPAPRPRALVHGDYRTGNFMVAKDGLTGILDWEFAHWGSPAEDIAWIMLRTWRFGQDKKRVGGFGSRGEFMAAYEAAGGARVDPSEIHFWEVLGNVRWAAGCALQGERYLSGEESDLELIAIPRRGVEMEFEALRLIERGP